ncbi:lipocalin family protein [Ferrimonas lipolytica]|uniref:Outer membrane lipoprotein Blc n=1 Tax=Ferrimonas lipolytica TaxID=2724191 RepID=A0A6H1UGT5_9GAMM|nr:lipocalin family protein [Ferrimonas lipolytica]QIZ77533.1 lipocalin [Ferrimonas lipolytica]
MRKLLLLLSFLSLAGCLGMPQGVQPVADFQLNEYLGKWYEIARLDHSFERGLQDVTAEYALRADGGVAVINRGYLAKTNEWKQAEGKAYFVNNEDEGYLKVSFFGPFYGSYVIFELKNDQYAFVSGPNTDYLWLLSRTPSVDNQVKAKFELLAKKRGFDITQLIYVEHK